MAGFFFPYNSLEAFFKSLCIPLLAEKLEYMMMVTNGG